jgi:hypothetical protein
VSLRSSDNYQDEGEFYLDNEVGVSRAEAKLKNILMDIRPGPSQFSRDSQKESLDQDPEADIHFMPDPNQMFSTDVYPNEDEPIGLGDPYVKPLNNLVNDSYIKASIENRNLFIWQKLNVNELSLDAYGKVDMIRETGEQMFVAEQFLDMLHYRSSNALLLFYFGPNGMWAIKQDMTYSKCS